MREKKTVPGAEQHRLGHAFDSQPTVSLMLQKPDGHIAKHCEATRDLHLGLHQGKNLGKRIHTDI
jgi:hypothetical protein